MTKSKSTLQSNKRQENKKTKGITPILIILVLYGIAFVIAYFNIATRVDEATIAKDYQLMEGTVVDSQKEYRTNEDGDSYCKYSAIVAYTLNGRNITFGTDYIYDKQPKNGRSIQIMVKNSNEVDAYVSKYDWITQTYLPDQMTRNVMLFMSLFFFCAGTIFVATVIPNSLVGGAVLSLTLILLGAGGTFLGFQDGIYLMGILILFALAGCLSMYQNVIVVLKAKSNRLNGKQPTEKEERLLVKIIDATTADDQRRMQFIMESKQTDEASQYFVYITEIWDLFQIGDYFTIPCKQIFNYEGYQESIQIKEYKLTDISYLSREDFKELGKIMKHLILQADRA